MVKPIVGCEYNIHSVNMKGETNKDYVFRGILEEIVGEHMYKICVTEYSGNGQRIGAIISISSGRLISLVARTNKEAARSLSKEW